mmetsp:Transcript_56615/g.128349  ORF Transcript_56615/g.128349 Transcript_56615/m.128349 type:complete len:272 (-) Transcript_56615:1194-2009(-)
MAAGNFKVHVRPHAKAEGGEELQRGAAREGLGRHLLRAVLTEPYHHLHHPKLRLLVERPVRFQDRAEVDLEGREGRIPLAIEPRRSLKALDRKSGDVDHHGRLGYEELHDGFRGKFGVHRQKHSSGHGHAICLARVEADERPGLLLGCDHLQHARGQLIPLEPLQEGQAKRLGLVPEQIRALREKGGLPLNIKTRVAHIFDKQGVLRELGLWSGHEHCLDLLVGGLELSQGHLLGLVQPLILLQLDHGCRVSRFSLQVGRLLCRLFFDRLS